MGNSRIKLGFFCLLLLVGFWKVSTHVKNMRSRQIGSWKLQGRTSTNIWKHHPRYISMSILILGPTTGPSHLHDQLNLRKIKSQFNTFQYPYFPNEHTFFSHQTGVITFPTQKMPYHKESKTLRITVHLYCLIPLYKWVTWWHTSKKKRNQNPCRWIAPVPVLGEGSQVFPKVDCDGHGSGVWPPTNDDKPSGLKENHQGIILNKNQ